MTTTTRMLLSHNCTLSTDQVSALSRTEFATIFTEGLKPQTDIQCSLIDNPHWIVEVRFSPSKSPTEVATLCAQTLSNQRLAERTPPIKNHTVMLLGGVKTTPVVSRSATSLQPGDWGVDVVETVAPDQFLAGLNWDIVTASKPAEQIFKVVQLVEQ